MSAKISILVVTRNRAASLKRTLESISRARLPESSAVEVIVVDNGSTDETPDVVRSLHSDRLQFRCVTEPTPGKSRCLNRAIGEAAGDILLFTDDDLLVPENWIEGLCRPILANDADATVGGCRIPAHLRRAWMTTEDLLAFSCDEGINDHVANPNLIGGNMAVARRVFQIVPGFDPEIGPGGASSPAGEDALFSFQVRAAGQRIARVPGVVVEHHFDADRLTRQNIRKAALNGARSDFYIGHHWLHTSVSHPLYRAVRTWCKLQYYRLRRLRQWRGHEAMPTWERMILQEMHANLFYWKHRRQPRNYEKFGLVKLNGERLPSHLPDRHVRAGL